MTLPVVPRPNPADADGRAGKFFVSNAFSFATDGKEFMYGSVGAPVHRWQT
jgi:hypothetical protein